MDIREYDIKIMELAYEIVRVRKLKNEYANKETAYIYEYVLSDLENKQKQLEEEYKINNQLMTDEMKVKYAKKEIDKIIKKLKSIKDITGISVKGLVNNIYIGLPKEDKKDNYLYNKIKNIG